MVPVGNETAPSRQPAARGSGGAPFPGRTAAGYAAALASAALVGLFTVVNKWLLSEAVPPLTAGAWTYLAAGAALLPSALRAGGLHL
ncbi:MAG: hypothetical protein IRY95_06000, partial [Clostridia bacterium]|nr:hypothetical protein [Clostridia bacterium]